MKNRAYKDFKEISELLYKMEKAVINSEREQSSECRKTCKELIRHVNEDMIDLMLTYLDPNDDSYAINVIRETRRDLTYITRVLDRIDPSDFDKDTYLRYQKKIIDWIDHNKDKVTDLMMNYYALYGHE